MVRARGDRAGDMDIADEQVADMKAEDMKRSKEMRCLACDGSGKWIAPAVMTTDFKRLPSRAFSCPSCEGRGIVIVTVSAR